MSGPTQLYAIFHLNLAFSSIDECDHFQVIKRCYWPLLDIVEKLEIPLGIEMTAYTLERILDLDRNWVEKFRYLINKQSCEIIASGDSQIIGPLVPAEVNSKNLQLGQDAYEEILGIRPTLAYVNEQAVSKGLLDIYLSAGFEAAIIEWDNPYSHNPDWSRELLTRPQQLITAEGKKIRVIWNNAVAFQKLQRFAHGEIIADDYLAHVEKFTDEDCAAFCVYGSDAEVFDYRPGRYIVEARQKDGEWAKIGQAFSRLKEDDRFEWTSPSKTLSLGCDQAALDLATFEHPISVKKQAKYNITRWALSGRNDLLFNLKCFEIYTQLKASATPSSDQWRKLCRMWASDLRTHLTENRSRDFSDAHDLHDLNDSDKNVENAFSHLRPIEPKYNELLNGYTIKHDKARNRLNIKSPSIQLSLNTYRGLSIDTLAFKRQAFNPICGTLAHGHFDHIRYAADFYSNHLVMERFRERDRIADLNPTSFCIFEDKGALVVTCEFQLAFSKVTKWYRIEDETLKCGFNFHLSKRPESSFRLGYVTLKNCNERPWFACHNGGYSIERFHVTDDFDHGAPVSSIVSATSALGATNGEVHFGSATQGLRLCWDQSQCAPLPMISSKKVGHQYLNRLWFSLIEADETLKPDGYLPSFSYSISALNLNDLP